MGERLEGAVFESKRLELALEAAELGTWEIDLAAGIVTASERTCAMFEFETAEPRAEDWIARLHPGDRERVSGELQRAIGGLSRYDTEYRVLCRDGSTRWVSAKAVPVAGSEDRATRLVGVAQDITARRQSDEQNQRLLAALAADLAALTRMHSLSTSLLETADLEPLLQEIMDAAVAIMGAERGTLQLVEGDSLRIVAHHGHQPPFLDFFASAEGRASVCGEAVKRGERVIVEDVESSPLFAGTPSLAVLREAGVRAVQSSPLRSRNGALLGILTTQWGVPHVPAEHDLWRVDLLVRQAADLIEHHRAEAALRRLAQFPEENPNPVLRVAGGGSVEYANAAARSCLAAMGAAAGQALPAAMQALVKRAIGEHHAVEAELGCERGRTFWFMAMKPPGEDYVNLYGRDITERKQAEERLFETHQRLEGLMNALPVGVSFSDDPTCERITGNPAVLAQFEAGPQDNLSASAPDAAAPGRQVCFFREGREIGDRELPLQRAVREGRVIPPMEVEVRLPSGRGWFAESSGAPIRDREGKVVGGVAVTVDITERKRSEERLRHAQRLESIGVLAGGVAHDFNNLLTAILGNASLLQMDLPAACQEHLDVIVASGEKAAALTRQLLAYAGKGQFQITDFDVSRLVRSSADLIRVSVSRSTDVHLDLPRQLPPVRGDSSQIQQVIMNLVINAAEAIEGRDGGRVSIVVDVRELDAASAGRVDSGIPPGRYVSIAVRDNGCGMSEETQSKIFDPFFTTKFAGRGLGLAAVHGILRSHKGAITVESRPGLGSTFTVYLPCSDPLAAAPDSGRAAAAARQGATILVVDDEDYVRSFTKIALERLGHRVLLAENGRQALDLLGRHADVDLVVLDIVMPGVGGVEAFAEMRDRWPEVAALVATGYGRQEAVRLGMPSHLPFLEKPYTIETLAAAVEKVLETRRR